GGAGGAGGTAPAPAAAAAALAGRPDVVVLNAGVAPDMKPIHEQSWEGFSRVWNNDVRAGLVWIQEALRLPLARGSRVLVSSSGAAIAGSPLSGGYAGAKRMVWMMAGYANGVGTELDRGIRSQAIIPQQTVGETDLGRAAAEAYARRKGVTPAEFLAGYGAPLPPQRYGELVLTLLTDPAWFRANAVRIRGDGMRALELISSTSCARTASASSSSSPTCASSCTATARA